MLMNKIVQRSQRESACAVFPEALNRGEEELKIDSIDTSDAI